MSIYRYPHSRIVVMGLCPSGTGKAPTFGDGPSVSASRMNRLYPGWRHRAIGANAWWTKRAYERGEPSHAGQIMWDTDCEIIVALGHAVQNELGLRPGRAYEWGTLQFNDRQVDVLRFPHPSGLNRHWNDPDNDRLATAALAEAFHKEHAP